MGRQRMDKRAVPRKIDGSGQENRIHPLPLGNGRTPLRTDKRIHQNTSTRNRVLSQS